MNRRIIYMAAVAMMLSLVCGCAGRGEKGDQVDMLTFEQVKAEEPSVMSTAEIIDLIKSDTTHKKVVYWFDLHYEPCLNHLQNEIASFYADRDTAEWRLYLVAGLNGLRLGEPDKEGNLVGNTAEEIRYFAEEYRKYLPELGFDLKDVYLHYDLDLEYPSYREKYYNGFFSYLIGEMFHSDTVFYCHHDGIPKLFVADRDNALLTNYYILVDQHHNDTLDKFYYPNDDYKFDVQDFMRHDTVVTVVEIDEHEHCEHDHCGHEHCNHNH